MPARHAGARTPARNRRTGALLQKGRLLAGCRSANGGVPTRPTATAATSSYATSTFRFSLLRMFDPATPTRELDADEGHFKLALDTRRHGLNGN